MRRTTLNCKILCIKILTKKKKKKIYFLYKLSTALLLQGYELTNKQEHNIVMYSKRQGYCVLSLWHEAENKTRLSGHHDSLARNLYSHCGIELKTITTKIYTLYYLQLFTTVFSNACNYCQLWKHVVFVYKGCHNLSKHLTLLDLQSHYM